MWSRLRRWWDHLVRGCVICNCYTTAHTRDWNLPALQNNTPSSVALIHWHQEEFCLLGLVWFFQGFFFFFLIIPLKGMQSPHIPCLCSILPRTRCYKLPAGDEHPDRWLLSRGHHSLPLPSPPSLPALALSRGSCPLGTWIGQHYCTFVFTNVRQEGDLLWQVNLLP